MKGLLNTVNIVLFGLFMAGIVLVLVSLFSLPEAMERASIKIDGRVMQEVMPVLAWRMIAIVITLLAGIGTLLVTTRLAVSQKVGSNAAHSNDGCEAIQEEASTESQPALGEMVQNIGRALTSVKEPDEKVVKWLSAVCREMEASQAVLYTGSNKTAFELHAAYAFDHSDRERLKYEPGEGLIGQSAQSDRMLILRDIPPDYIRVFSGLGSADPAFLLVMPLKDKKEVVAVVEIASFTEITEQHTQGIESSFSHVLPAIRDAEVGIAKNKIKDPKMETV